MFGFKKKEKVDFNADKQVGTWVAYDATQKLYMFNGKKVIPQDNIKSYHLKYGNKTYTRKDLGQVVVGGALFGVLGIMTAKTNVNEEISSITIMLNLKDGHFYSLPLTIGKMKASRAKPILESAERIIALLDETMPEE